MSKLKYLVSIITLSAVLFNVVPCPITYDEDHYQQTITALDDNYPEKK